MPGLHRQSSARCLLLTDLCTQFLQTMLRSVRRLMWTGAGWLRVLSIGRS